MVYVCACLPYVCVRAYYSKNGGSIAHVYVNVELKPKCKRKSVRNLPNFQFVCMVYVCACLPYVCVRAYYSKNERWGAGVEYHWRGGGLGSSTIFKKFNEPYAPS